MVEEKAQWWGDEREIAELIWCAAHLHRIIAPPSPEGIEQPEDFPPADGVLSPREPLKDSSTPPASQEEPRTPIATYPQNLDRHDPDTDIKDSQLSDPASPVRIPDPFPLPKPVAISKKLLPLARRVPGILANELDIDATVEQTAEANGLPTLAFRRPLERWFGVHLLIDHSPSMAFWGDLAQGVATLFRWQGFFRDVRLWQFETRNSEPRLYSGAERIPREIRSLIAPGRNRLFVVLTDTLGKAWHSGAAFAALAILGERHPVTIAHVFPQSLWRRTALHQAIQRPLQAPHSGCANSKLKVRGRLHTKDKLYWFPIFNLSPDHFKTWADFLAGIEGNSIQGVLIRQEAPKVDISNPVEEESESVEETPEDLLRGFLTDASPQARELAQVLAAVPLIPPVMRLAQRQFLPDSEHWHLAEVFFSGLIQRSPLGPGNATVLETWYEFREGVCELLLKNSDVLRTVEIWRDIGDFIERHYGSLRDFQALIPNPDGSSQKMAKARYLYFAQVKAAVLMTWGGEYAMQAQELMKEVAAYKRHEDPIDLGDVKLLTFEFKVTTLTVDEPPNLQPFEFDVALIEDNLVEIADEITFTKIGKHLNSNEKLLLQRTLANQTYEQIAASAEYSESYLKNVATKLWRLLSEVFGEKVTKTNLKTVLRKLAADRHITIHRHRQQSQYFIEDLGNGVQLEMVAIPGGSFQMGSPKHELNRMNDESPQHEVTIKPFFLGKYPVTQAQWKAVAALPQVNRELDPNPSSFKGENRPVESVSWYDAVEFCDRLARATGKPYRLPIESEWEYACRAGTNTPFHFGETITSELANYNGEYTYGRGPKGIYRQETTEVGSFGVANAFGLYDMHGNVWEWCADHWHKRAPTDGSAWIEAGDENDNSSRLLRGGSWYFYPRYCRCAYRNHDLPDIRDNYVGFRVVCGGRFARTP